MKVLIELDLDDPKHWSVLQTLFPLKPETGVHAVSAKWEPAPQPEAPAPEPVKADPTPSRDDVNKMFAELYSKDAARSQQIGADFRKRFGPDSEKWTEAQLKEADTILQAEFKL